MREWESGWPRAGAPTLSEINGLLYCSRRGGGDRKVHHKTPAGPTTIFSHRWATAWPSWNRPRTLSAWDRAFRLPPTSECVIGWLRKRCENVVRDKRAFHVDSGERIALNCLTFAAENTSNFFIFQKISDHQNLNYFNNFKKNKSKNTSNPVRWFSR